MDREKGVPSHGLKTVSFPECSKTCEAIKHLGAGECESVCPWKFKDVSEEEYDWYDLWESTFEDEYDD